MQAKDYRPDIDVLRAIAVLAVIFYHAHIPYFSGGYAGVSIFFVISGYLITGIIKRRLESGTFSFAEFYENRVRRIFPALFVMVFCVVLFEWVTSVDVAGRRDVFSSAKRVLLTVPNFYFFLNTNYFDPAAETMPLLHTWSLGVEEQFYFIFPLLIFVSYIYRKNNAGIIRLLAALFAASFIFSVIFVFYNQKFTFYMLPARAWELLTGALLAYTGWTPKEQKSKVFLVCLGLFLMGVSIVGYSDNIYPGFWALFPCLGAVLYIAGGTGLSSSLSVFTNNRILVFVGVISYSLYLWHWPILVYYQNWLYRREITAVSAFVLLAVIFAVSVFSWRFVEKPVRQRPVFKKHTVLWGAVACCFGIFMLFVNNLRFSVSDFYAEYSFTAQSGNHASYTAHFPAKKIILVGDSHSEHLCALFFKLAQENAVSYDNYCMAPLGTYNDSFSVSEVNQAKAQEKAFADIVRKGGYETAVIAYRYDYHLRGVDIVRKNTVFYPLKSLKDGNCSPEQALFLALAETARILKENGVKKIYVVSSVPQAQAVVCDSANKLAYFLGYDSEAINRLLGESVQEFAQRTQRVRLIFERLADAYPEIVFLNPAPFFLNEKHTGYEVVRNKKSLYSDDDHLSAEGALLLEPLFAPVFSSE